jgi:hypothetical protein
MSKIYLDFDVDKPLSEVWQFGLDSRRIPEWQFDISEVIEEAGPITGVGHAYTLVYQMWGKKFNSPVQVTRFEPLHTIETSGRTPIGGFFRSSTHMRAIELGTHIEWQMEYQLPLGFIGKLLDLLIFRKAFEDTVKKYNDNYKAVVEGKSAPHQTIAGKRQSNHPAIQG